MRVSIFYFLGGWTVPLSVFTLCFTLSLSRSLSTSLSLSFFLLFTNTNPHPLISTASSASYCRLTPGTSHNRIRWGEKDWQSLSQTAAFLTELHQLYWKCRQHCDDWRWQAKRATVSYKKIEITHEYHNGNEQAKLLSLFARCRVTEKEEFYRNLGGSYIKETNLKGWIRKKNCTGGSCHGWQNKPSTCCLVHCTYARFTLEQFSLVLLFGCYITKLHLFKKRDFRNFLVTYNS